MPSQLILVTGGARSGKSAFAERQLAAVQGHHSYIATAEIYDDEMAQRVKLHQERRPVSWRTYEAPRQMNDVLPNVLDESAGVLLDCLTVYMSTFLYDHRDEADAVILAKAIDEVRRWIETIRSYDDKTVIIVTNEIGSGIVPMEHVSRLYRDVVGKLNQYVASEADAVYWTVCGIPVCIKGPRCRLGGI